MCKEIAGTGVRRRPRNSDACVRGLLHQKSQETNLGGEGISKQMELEHQYRQDGLWDWVSMLRELQEGNHPGGLGLRHQEPCGLGISRGGGGDGEETAGHSHVLSADQWCSCQKWQKSPFLLPLRSQLNILHSAQNKCLILH